jgi:hypothetical protein
LHAPRVGQVIDGDTKLISAGYVKWAWCKDQTSYEDIREVFRLEL